MSTLTWARGAGLALGIAAVATGGCRKGERARGLSGRDAAPSAGAIAIDGRFQDWPVNVATSADADWVYFKVTVQGLDAPLQAAPETLALWLDADSSGRTGAKMASPREASGLGVDLIVEFSPPGDAAGTPNKRGVAVYGTDDAGRAVALPAGAVELMSAPTYASDLYEVRVSRHINPADSPRLARALAAKGRARAMFALIGADGQLSGWSDPESFTMPTAAPSAPVADAVVPAKPAGAIRVLSWNVLKGELMKNPGPFARVVQVVDPDVVLLQEWETSAATAQAWFTATVTGTHPWNAWTVSGTDVVIVSAYPLTSVGPQVINLDAAEGEPVKAVRFASAMASTPAGDILLGTAHLKCCGSAGSPEDRRRINEASAINAAMNQAFAQAKTPVRLIAGDFNLVGTRAPLDLLRAGLDADGSELAVAPTPVLGDRAMYTWSDHKTEFPDGRLDYAVYSDASADLANAFVIDGRRLSEKALARLGLDRRDTGASDHLPLVVDLVPRR